MDLRTVSLGTLRLRTLSTAAVKACLVAALTLCASGNASAQARSMRITSFDADLTVMPSGKLVVTERITAQFSGAWNGIYRTIPVRYSMDSGEDYTITLAVHSAKDEQGNELRMETDRQGAYVKIKAWIPGATDATHTLVLNYTVDGALRFFDEHDELYWNVTGTDWEYPIETVTARVFLPGGATNGRSTAFTGVTGSRSSDATFADTDGITTFRTTRPLGLHEGMTIVRGWDPGVVARPTPADKALRATRSNMVLLFPVLAFLLMLTVWRKYGRDPDLGSIAPRYDPPSGMSPAEAGILVDLSVDSRDVAATLVDLAVRGHIRIHEYERQKILVFSATDYRIERLTARSEWAALKPHERQMLEGLFKGNPDEVTLSDLENEFYKTLAEMKSSLSETLTKAGYYRRSPTQTRAAFIAGGIATGFGISFVSQILVSAYGISAGIIVFAAVSSAIIIIVFGWLMPARTIRGTNALRDILGFEEFLSRVEGDRVNRVIARPELFEKYLPFAMAFNVDHQWAKAFEGIVQHPPQWYAGPHGSTFRTSLFINDLGRMTAKASTAMASAPRSSSGSGFSGGGSSGGGFGGGGGGGF